MISRMCVVCFICSQLENGKLQNVIIKDLSKSASDTDTRGFMAEVDRMKYVDSAFVAR